MTRTKHVILGAGGAITRALVPTLLANKQEVHLVSRRGGVMPGTQGISADVSDYSALLAAVPEGSTVHLLVGLRYDIRVWSEVWPRIMDNVIRVCREKQALLVFFDNVYMYGLVDGPMTEETPHHPISRKGQVRARIVERLRDEYVSGRIRAIIARSADFYGPGAERSGVPNLLVVQKLLDGGKAQWMANAERVHSLTYTTDCGQAIPLLVADESAHNQVWHLPTAHPPITGRRFIELVAAELGVAPRYDVLSGWMLRMAGLFDRTIRELPEMLYQNTNDYVFDSAKFEGRFPLAATPYARGVSETVDYHRQLGR